MAATKTDYKRELHELFAPPRKPVIIDVPELSFLMVDGHGDPNTCPAYREAIEALFSVSYTLKFTIRSMPHGIDYGVMPLESLWWGKDVEAFTASDKSAWSWTAMVMQPDLVTAELVAEAVAAARSKRAIPAADLMRLERFREGPSAQVMYLGPYADEGPTIATLHAFIAERGYVPAGKHHEIYLGDPRRSAPKKLRTIIRQPVKPPL
jgi:hypothetical protein